MYLAEVEKILTERAMRKPKHNCLADRRASSYDHKKILEDELNIKISVHTVSDFYSDAIISASAVG